MDLIASVVETGAWEVSGIRNVEHWVTWKCAISSGRARSLVAIASRLGELPVTRAALCAGELSVDQVGVIARHAPAHVEAQVCELARHATVDQLQRVLPRYVFAHPLVKPGETPEAADPEPADPEPTEPEPTEPEPTEPEPTEPEPADPGVANAEPAAPPPEPEYARPAPEPAPPPEPEYARRVGFGHDEDGSWWMTARLRPDEGALVERALAAARDELFAASEHPEGTRPAPGDVSWADALVAMADRSMGEGAGVRPGRDRHLILVHLRGDRGAHGASLHLGPALPDSLRRHLGCDGRIRPVFEAGGVALSVGRTQRIVPERTRVAIEDRDGGCRVPGCLRRRWLQIHHLRHWEDGGATDTANLLALCSHHHRLHHRGALGIAGDADLPDGVTFTDEQGRTIDPCGRPTPPGSVEAGVGRLDLRVGTWVHPLGEHLNPKFVHFDERVGAG